MYLEHFGLTEPPFRITPVTVFFFSGANRGEILDALIYSLSEAEGIIKVSGEVGSGKTMLCRMLLERLPDHVETIYLANPSLSREEMLYAIADGLGLNIDGERVGVIMRNIQNKLEEKAREGKRIVVLVDEAHAMPPDTLEELRLLYNLQVGNFKLLQIVLFGQPELDAKLNQPNMRQLKDRIVHHFNMQPLSRNILESYLMFRMRAAGYHGPNIFSPSALKLIADTSNGLLRRVNILADKSLLAAFVEDTHNIETRHVQAAMRDSELKPVRSLPVKKLLLATALAILLIAGLSVWLMADKPQTPPAQALTPATSPPPIEIQPDNAVAPATDASPSPAPQPALSQAPEPDNVAAISTPPPVPASEGASTPKDTGLHMRSAQPAALPAANGNPANTNTSLFEQRLEASNQLLEQTASTNSGQEKTAASIQLFYKEEFKQESIEGFLRRADGLGVLSEIYLAPVKSGNKNGLRVLYGAYPSINAARNATRELPARYQEAFATSIYIW
ncbi:MAG: hypothetical protein A2V79_05825 [Betaproteobacteria bacterium RBG_16_56_24]|nr:MAG: hypothetical protein A2V79_05825 [Betaproteobacteria bacterium RBG_16_56_24]